MISKGMDVSRFFPDVVRNVITTVRRFPRAPKC